VGGRTAWTVARLGCVWALLAGLAVMHVLPATACPEAGASHAALAMPMTPDGSADHGHLVVEPAAAAVTRQSAGLSAAGSGADAGMRGAVCSAIPPSAGIAGLLALLALGLIAGTRPTWPGSGGAPRRGPNRRAPPRAGVLLLHDLCVSRT
jgi:hypothetical protein